MIEPWIAAALRDLIIVIIAGLFPLLAVYVDRKWRESTARKQVLQALYVEVDMNLAIVQRNMELLLTSGILSCSVFHTLAYQNARSSGELINLPKELLSRIEVVYDRIDFFNNRITSSRGVADRMPNS